VKPTKSFSAATLDAAMPDTGVDAPEPGLPLIGLPEDSPPK